VGQRELHAQLAGAVSVHLGGSNRLRKSPIREFVIQDPKVRLHKVRKTRYEDVLNVLDVEKTVQKVALRSRTVTKGCKRLVVLLFHRTDVLVGVSHSCVCRILQKKPVDGVSVCKDDTTRTTEDAVKRTGEGHLGVAG